MIQIYHNPRCGKSRNCLAFLSENESDIEIINYLTNPPSFEQLKDLLQKLNKKPIEIIRVKESIWVENFKEKSLSDIEIIQAMVDYPILIERPIVIKDGKAIIGRIPEEVSEFIKK